MNELFEELYMRFLVKARNIFSQKMVYREEKAAKFVFSYPGGNFQSLAMEVVLIILSEREAVLMKTRIYPGKGSPYDLSHQFIENEILCEFNWTQTGKKMDTKTLEKR